MRQLTFNGKQFKDFVFTQMGRATSSGGDSDWETALRVIKKLKDPALTEVIPLTDEEQKAENEGTTVFYFRRLIEDHATWEFEEDEWKFLKTKLEANKKNVLLLAAEDFEELLRVIRDAKQVDTKKKKKEAIDA